MNLDEFILSNLRNLNVDELGFKQLYVRKGPKYIDDVRYEKVLDLANAEVEVQRQGAFTNRIKLLRKTHPDLVLYAENVMVYEFALSLQRMGFVPVKRDTLFGFTTRKLIGNTQFFCASLYWLP